MSGIGRLDHACQTGRHSHTERGLDLYETPEPAVVALLRVETLPLRIWEPARRGGARSCGYCVPAVTPSSPATWLITDSRSILPAIF